MNGQEKKLFTKMYGDISHQLADLQARFDERWEAHNKRALEIYNDNKKCHEKIFDKLDILPCAERRWQGKAIMWLYGLVGTIFAIMLKDFIIR